MTDGKNWPRLETRQPCAGDEGVGARLVPYDVEHDRKLTALSHWRLDEGERLGERLGTEHFPELNANPEDAGALSPKGTRTP